MKGQWSLNKNTKKALSLLSGMQYLLTSYSATSTASIQFSPSIHLKPVKTHWAKAVLIFATHHALTVCCLQHIPQVSVRNMELISSCQRNELQNDGWLASMRLNCLHLLCVLRVWNRWMCVIFTALPGLVIACCILNVPAVHNLWCALEREREMKQILIALAVVESQATRKDIES